MAINVTVKEAEIPEPIPEGVYKAKVKEIGEGSGEFGDYIKFTFEITEGEKKGVTRTAIASKKLSRSTSGKTSKLYDFVKALTKAEPSANETLDIEGLVGKACQIIVKNGKEKDGVIFQNSSTIMPS